ncbi:MAG: 4-(cytidine 5'-diphospho)-2-C-methyl-D-erythritol kinase [Oscillospiraceae bacterium]|jgi:4-diphosphocytidyl-2-C-methyl-D-erythritol kinase|nr:4-(cytidine 5'-diphospho)-2-C-methyl-D-erythritol kinase [Oscillospiraceae bacterium]
MTIHETAYAKLNLSLDVTGLLADGYHSVSTVMQSVSLCDDIDISPSGRGWFVECGLPYVPTGASNLAAEAAELFRSRSGVGPEGGRIDILKRIPVRGGFGGGSSDAAAVLRALDREYGRPFDRPALEKLSGELGSDVPFCVCGGTAHATGRGERLRALPFLKDCHFIICRPNFSCSTPELFAALDRTRLRIHPDMPGMLDAVEAGDIQGVAVRMFNVFEEVLPRRHAETVRRIKALLIDAGALGACMTGSGSGVFGVFADENSALEGLERMRGSECECCAARTEPPADI